VKARSTGNNNHGEDWGKTAVEMAILRNEALNIKGGKQSTLMDLGFGKPVETKEKKATPGFF